MVYFVLPILLYICRGLTLGAEMLEEYFENHGEMSCIAQGAQLNALWGPRGVELRGKRLEGGPEGGDMCIHIDDSLRYTAEHRTTL